MEKNKFKQFKKRKITIVKKKYTKKSEKTLKKVSRIIMQKFLFDMVHGLYVSTKRDKIVLNKIQQYLLGNKNQFNLFSMWQMSYTVQKMLTFVQHVTQARKTILVNTVKKNYKPFSVKKNKNKKIKKRVKKVIFLFSLNKWVGGTLTNFRKTYQRFLYYKYAFGRLETRSVRKHKIIYARLLHKKKPRLPHFLFSLREHHWAVNEAKLLGIKVAQCAENDFRTNLVDFNLFFRQNKTSLNLILTLINNCISQTKFAERIFYHKKFIKFIKRKSMRKRRLVRIRRAIFRTIAYYNKIKRKIK